MRIAIAHKKPDKIKLISHLVTDMGLPICWTCHSAKDVTKLCATDSPDLLLIQLDLPDINAHELFRNLLKSSITILAISDPQKHRPGDIFEAMSAGVQDVSCEPDADDNDSLKSLKNKILTIKKLYTSLSKIDEVKQASSAKRAPLIAIGSSTGGPAALLNILKQLPQQTGAIWVIIQHMDIQFSQGLAQWLNDQTGLNIQIARNKQTPKMNHIYMAGTNDHLIINKAGQFEYTKEPADYPYRPSVDAFFETALNNWPNKIIGVLLTGMGRDGANGLLSLYKHGMLTITQSQKSCAVYGMPKAAVELNAVSIELDINDITDKIIKNIL